MLIRDPHQIQIFKFWVLIRDPLEGSLRGVFIYNRVVAKQGVMYAEIRYSPFEINFRIYKNERSELRLMLGQFAPNPEGYLLSFW